MNARYLIFGSLAAMLLLVGALLLAGGDGSDDPPRNDGPPAAAPAPAPETLSDTTVRDSLAPNDSTLHPDSTLDPDAANEGGASGEDGSGTGGGDPRSGGSDSGTQASAGSSGSASSAGEPAAETPSARSGQEADLDAILRATSERYEGVRAMQAAFEQEIDNRLLGRQMRSAGMLYQRQPDLFLMRFSQPEGDVVVSDGDYFWVYYPSVDPRQVIRSARGAQGLDLRSQFIGDPTQRFESEYHGREDVRGRTAHVVTLVPREALGYRQLKVWIDAEDHLVRRFELTEENSNVRRFELTDLRVNPTLPDELFEFEPPENAHVVTR